MPKATYLPWLVDIYILYNFHLFNKGIVGSALTYACTPELRRESLGATTLTPGLEPEQGFGMELLFTFILVFFVFSITDSKKNTEPYGTTLGIGVVIWVCHVCLV